MNDEWFVIIKIDDLIEKHTHKVVHKYKKKHTVLHDWERQRKDKKTKYDSMVSETENILEPSGKK